MNKIKIVILLIQFCGLMSNPVQSRYEFSEIFSENGCLKVELVPIYIYQSDVDSIIVQSSKSQCYVNLEKIKNKSEEFVLNHDMLSDSLIINPLEDFVKIKTYLYHGSSANDSVSWSYENQQGLGSLLKGQSINRCTFDIIHDPTSEPAEIMAKSNNPTPGTENDSCKGNWSGILLDSFNTPISNTNFVIEYPSYIYHGEQIYQPLYKTKTDENGKFSISAYARKYKIDKISEDFSWISSFLPIESIFLTVKPDSKIVQNIKMLKNTSINEKRINKNKSIISNYPNPFNPTTTIYYNLRKEINPKTTSIEITNSNGQQVAKYKLNNAVGSIIFNANFKSTGYYNYRLINKGRVLNSGSMVFLK